MELLTISELTKNYDISTRTLRYYEQIGLLESTRKEDYSYRVYDENAVRRLQQIIILRKLRIPLKQISEILEDESINKTIKILQENIETSNLEINSIATIRNIMIEIVNRINALDKSIKMIDVLQSDKLINVLSSVTPLNNKLKENHSMDDLKKANDVLTKLNDIRVIFLPPATVAASHYVGENPEDHANDKLVEFIENSNIIDIKPDFRIYGFNNPCPTYQGETYGYEFWITIPDDMEVPDYMEKKHFDGGLYFAHSIKMGNFYEWQPFYEYAQHNSEYDMDEREPLGMGGSLEEELNAYTFYKTKNKNPMEKQLDLLIPIKAKEK